MQGRRHSGAATEDAPLRPDRDRWKPAKRGSTRDRNMWNTSESQREGAMAVLVFQTDPWTLGPPTAAEYGDPAWFRQGLDADLFGPLAWSTVAERGFDWTDLEFFTKYVHLLTLTELSGTGFTADLRIYGDAASVVSFSGQDFGFLWPWPGATAAGLTGGTVTGFSGTIQGRGAFTITGLSVPVTSLRALASRTDAAAIGDANACCWRGTT